MKNTRSARNCLGAAGVILITSFIGCVTQPMADTQEASGFSAPLRAMGMAREDVRVGDVFVAPAAAKVRSPLTLDADSWAPATNLDVGTLDYFGMDSLGTYRFEPVALSERAFPNLVFSDGFSNPYRHQEPASRGQEKESAFSDKWEFHLTPYAHLPAVDLDATVSGVTQNIDLSFSDLIDDFDIVAFSVHAEVWKGNWGLVTRGAYLALDGDFGTPTTAIDVDIVDFSMDVLGTYRFEPVAMSEDRFPYLTFNPLAGLRYHYLRQKIKLTPGPRVGDSFDWVEPVVGGRVILTLSEKVDVRLAVDVGGFGIGSASDLTSNFLLATAITVSESVDIRIGYLATIIDYSRGSGINKFGLDGDIQGLLVGVTVRF